MRIIGPPSAPQATVLAALGKLNPAPLFVQDIAPALWQAGLDYTIDPVGMIAQSYKETGAGRFGGAVDARWCNTAGIKVRYVGKVPGVDDGDRPLAHQQFPGWRVGARAQAQHLRAYAGWPLDPAELVVDPRYDYVTGQRCEQWEDLGGRWAPSPTYGAEVVVLARTLQAG